MNEERELKHLGTVTAVKGSGAFEQTAAKQSRVAGRYKT